MLGRSTPSPGQAPAGAPNLNGNIETAIPSAVLLGDQTAATGGTSNGKAAATSAAQTVDETAAATTAAAGEVERVAEETPTRRTEVSEATQASEAGGPVQQAGHAEPVSASRPTRSDPTDGPRVAVHASMVRGVRALLERPGVRSIALGVALVGLARVLGASSVLAVPVLVLGVAMLIVGFIGPRLHGRFALEFGPDGASIEIVTHFSPLGSTRVAPSIAPLAPWKPIGDFAASDVQDTEAQRSTDRRDDLRRPAADRQTHPPHRGAGPAVPGLAPPLLPDQPR